MDKIETENGYYYKGKLSEVSAKIKAEVQEYKERSIKRFLKRTPLLLLLVIVLYHLYSY